jgi:hypothetical protein
MYPNPTSDLLTVDLSKYNGRSLNIQIYDLSGFRVFDLSEYSKDALRMNVSGYKAGLYLIQISDGKSTVQKKLMIKK